MGGEFCNNRTSQYLRDKKKKRKKEAQKQGGENSPISPPLDPRLVRNSYLKLRSYIAHYRSRILLDRHSK